MAHKKENQGSTQETLRSAPEVRPSLTAQTPGLDVDRPARALLIRGWSWGHQCARELLSLAGQIATIARESWNRARSAKA